MAHGPLRHRADDVGAGLARFVLDVFFRDVEVIGKERAPRGVPLLVIANHVNNLIDPMLVMGYTGVRPRFLAKSTLFKHPLVAPALLLLGALPVYRRKDGAPVSRNIETFTRCRVALAEGATIAIFPEGYSHNEPGSVPLKTGAARIALEAGAHGAPGLRVLPVGLVYEDKEHFRSRVLVQVGEPIDPAPDQAVYARAPREAVKSLTARIAAGLSSVTAPFASWEEARLIDRAVDLAVEGDPATLPLSQRWSLWRSFIARYAEIEKADPERAQRLVEALRRYDEPATFKVMGALLFFPVWWALEAGVARVLGGPWAALAVAVAAPAAGLVSLRIHDRQRRRPLAVGTRFAERAALRDSRAALRRQIRDVVGGRP